MSTLYVHVKNADTNEVVKELGPMSEGKAIKCANGMDINLSDDFYTEVVDSPLSSDGGESTAQSVACPTDKEK